MFDDKYLLDESSKQNIIGGFAFWNFSIAFGLITSAITNIVQIGASIYNATQSQTVQSSSSSYVSNKQANTGSFIPYLDSSSPYVRLSKYPSKSNVGLFM